MRLLEESILFRQKTTILMYSLLCFALVNVFLFCSWQTASAGNTEVYTITFDSGGGSTVTSLNNVTPGATINAPTPPTFSGYTFAGWYQDNDFVSPWNFTTDTVTSNITLYAKWTAATYTVAFDSQGGSAVNSITDAVYGATISEPAEPTFTGYTFAGWYNNDDFTTQWDFSTDTVTSNITLYAKWNLLYTITFDSGGGSTVTSLNNVTPGATVNAPTPPTFSGHTFAGWYKDNDFTIPWDFNSDTVTSSITLYAKWTANQVSSGGSGSSGILIPIVRTDEAGNITTGSAVLNGFITAQGSSNINGYGFRWGASPQELNNTLPVATDNHLGSFSASLNNLVPGTTYYFEAYATNSNGTTSGNILSFSTPQPQDSSSNKTVLRFYIGKTYYYLNDQMRNMDTAPVILGGRTLLPITYVTLSLGGSVEWKANERKVTITLNGTTIVLWIGQNMAQVNGISTAIDPGNPSVVPIIEPPGRTMLPLSFIATNLNCQVDWDQEQQMVRVTYPKQ